MVLTGTWTMPAHGHTTVHYIAIPRNATDASLVIWGNNNPNYKVMSNQCESDSAGLTPRGTE